MSAPTIRQSTAWKEVTQTTSTVATNAWGVATLAGSRIIVQIGITDNGNTIDVSGVNDGAALTELGEVVRLDTGAPAESMRTWQHLNAGAGVAAPTVTFTGIPGGGVHLWVQAHEIVGDDPTLTTDPNWSAASITAILASGAGSTFTASGLPGTARTCLLLGAASVPNIQAIALAAGSPYSQVTANNTGGSGSSTKVSALVASEAQSAPGGGDSLAMTIPAGNTRQWAVNVVAIPGPAAGGGGGGTLQFPLQPPDYSTYQVIDDPGIANPSLLAQRWSLNLSPGQNVVLNAPLQRSRGLNVTGGGNLVCLGLRIKYGTVRDSEAISLGGGDVGRIIHLENVWIDPNGLDMDCIKTKSPFSGRHLQLKTFRCEKLIGSTNPSTFSPNGVHADFIQAAGGVGQVWEQDVEVHTTYQAHQLQREATLGPGAALAASGWSRSGSVVTYTVAAGHGLVAGNYLNASGFSEPKVTGGYKIDSTTSTTLVVTLAASNLPAGTSGGAGTVQQMTFPYSVDGFHALRVYVKGYANPSGAPSNALGAGRWGARTAPRSNTHDNEDGTPLTDTEAANPVLDLTNFYIDPSAGSAADFVKPDTGAANTVVRSSLNTAPTPDEVTWPSWTKTGTSKALVGAPPIGGGHYVILSGGFPVATNAGATAPPAPTNTTAPVIAPSDPVSSDLLHVSDLGQWSGIDSATRWTVTFYERQGTSGSGSSVQTAASLTQAQALAAAFQLAGAPDVGNEYRFGLIADNGTASSEAFSQWTNLVSDPFLATLTATLEADFGRVRLQVDSSDGSRVTITRKHPSGQVVTVRGMENLDLSGTNDDGGTAVAWDYELPIGRACQYQATIIDDATTQQVKSNVVTITWNSATAWLKDPLAPARNRPVMLTSDTGAQQFQTPTGVFQVMGKPTVTTVGDVRSAAAGQVALRTDTLDDAAAVHYLTASGRVLLLQTPVAWGYGSMYLAVTQVTEERPSSDPVVPMRRITLDYLEADSPVGGAGAFSTWQDVLNVYASWQAVIDAYDTWLELIEATDRLAVRAEVPWRGA